MAQTRRELLETWAAAAALASLGGWPEQVMGAGNKAPALLIAGTTLEQTTAPGEPFVVRQDLGTRAQSGRAGRRTGLSSIVQFTDTHVVDAQSPARVEY